MASFDSGRVRASSLDQRACSWAGSVVVWCPFVALVLWHGLPRLSHAPHAVVTTTAEIGPLSPARVVTLRAPGPRMIRVPQGRFAMGSTLKEIMQAAELCQRFAPTEACRPQLFANEQHLHSVELSAYWLDRTEVTVADYERCVAQGRCAPAPYHAGASRFRRSDFPVSLVTWQDAERYCLWRGARLPSEAEFERASRGLTRRQFPWGEFYNSRVANHGRYGVAENDARDGFEELAPVGSFPDGRTPDGFMDLAGNVAEWVFDRYGHRYPDRVEQNPTGPDASHHERVTRGGHFRSAPVWLRGAARQPQPPDERLPYVGFRCATSAGKTTSGEK